MRTDDYLDSVASYTTSAFAGFTAWLGDVNWMALGAAVLLIARLAVDVPSAVDYWKKKRTKK